MMSRCCRPSPAVDILLVQSAEMFSRTVAIFLALVLVWAGFATQEEAFSIASQNHPPAYAGPENDASHRVSDGSVDDHHLDDQPVQAHAENLADQPGLFLVNPEARVSALAMTRPTLYITAAFTAPYLEALQRPPCVTALVA
jgi:hypothetical protein